MWLGGVLRIQMKKKVYTPEYFVFTFTFLDLHSDLSSKNVSVRTQQARKILQIYLPTELFSAVYRCQNDNQMDPNECLSPSHPLQSKNAL